MGRFVSNINMAFHAGVFLFRNIQKSLNIAKAPQLNVGSVVLRGMTRGDEPELLRIHHCLMGGHIPLPTVNLYRWAGSKLVLVAVNIDERDADPVIVGMNMYHFNKRDTVEETIHEGFLGVAPDFQRRGIGTKLRIFAKNHFQINGIAAISTKISSSNVASLKSARNAGFRPVQKIKLAPKGEDALHLICKLN